MTRFWETDRAECCRLFERERKIPTVKKDRQMIMTENIFLTLYCHRLLAAVVRKYFSLRKIRGFPFLVIFP